LLANAPSPLHYSDHQIGHGRAFHDKACAMSLEGIVSKRADAAYAPGNRGLWLKVKCLHQQEFVVVGWTEPEGSRPFLGALLLGYYDPNGKLVYAGRVGSGINTAELERLSRRLQPLATDKMPLEAAPYPEGRNRKRAFATLFELHAGALFVGGAGFFLNRREQLVTLASRHAVPAIYAWREFAAAGGRISYGTKVTESFRQAGGYAGRILKGAKPADLPIQQPTIFELVVNLNTAKALGLTIPPSILSRADVATSIS
jgi:hypothetical protein